MKKYLIVSFILILLVFLLPWMTVSSVSPGVDSLDSPTDALSSVEDPDPQPTVEHIPTGELDSAISITVLHEGEIITMDLGSYLVGVLRSEMPASFHIEALKAQAVAARTYTIYKILNGGSPSHPDADTCTDINCCKAYSDSVSAAANWGDQAAVYEEKLRTAVMETDGQYVLYGGIPVLAVFHSSSAGMTMNAEDVWSSALPYLVSVNSPETEESVPNFHSEVSFSPGELRAMLKEALPDAQLDGNPSTWFTGLRQKSNGTVVSLCVGGVEVSGSELRTILSLRSACFTFSFSSDAIIFSVLGYGHGVGLSQYGANVLAQSGLTYEEILRWYYTDTSIDVYSLPSHSA